MGDEIINTLVPPTSTQEIVIVGSQVIHLPELQKRSEITVGDSGKESRGGSLPMGAKGPGTLT